MSTFRINCMSIAKQSPSGLGAQSALIDWWMAARLTDWRTDSRPLWLTVCRSDFSLQMDFSWVFKWLPGCRDWHFIWAKSKSTRSLCQLLPNGCATQKSARTQAIHIQVFTYTYTLYRPRRATVVNSRKLALAAPVWVSETLVARKPHVRRRHRV